jgi:hypothetical protein
MKKLLLAGLLAVFLLSGCLDTLQTLRPCVQGDGNIINQSFPITESFTEVQLNGQGDLYIMQGEQFVSIESDKSLVDVAKISFENGKMIVDNTKPCVIPTDRYNIYVSIPVIEGLYVNGSGKIVGSTKITGDSLSLATDGESDIDLEVEVNSLSTSFNGSGQAVLKGSAAHHDLLVNGYGSFEAFDLLTETSALTANGSTNAQVQASDRLDITINGSGSVQYKGDATVNQTISGSGSVSKAE